MDLIKRGAMMAFGALAALAIVAAIVIGGMYAFRYLNTDHERVALVEAVEEACRNGRGVFREPPSSMGVFQQQDYIERQQVGIQECGEAKMRLLGYDAGFDLGDG